MVRSIFVWKVPTKQLAVHFEMGQGEMAVLYIEGGVFKVCIRAAGYLTLSTTHLDGSNQ